MPPRPPRPGESSSGSMSSKCRAKCMKRIGNPLAQTPRYKKKTNREELEQLSKIALPS